MNLREFLRDSREEPFQVANWWDSATTSHTVVECFNPLPTIENSLKKQKSMYKVLMPSINPPHTNSYGLMGAHDAYKRYWLVKG